MELVLEEKRGGEIYVLNESEERSSGTEQAEKGRKILFEERREDGGFGSLA